MVASSSPFQIAGILVRTHPTDLTAVAARLSELPGVDVHQHEASTGRLVVTLETLTADDQRNGIERIRRQSGVLGAELTYHYAAPPGAEDNHDAKPASGDPE